MSEKQMCHIVIWNWQMNIIQCILLTNKTKFQHSSSALIHNYLAVSNFFSFWKPMQMGGQEAPLEKPANLGKFGNVVEIADNLQANVREQTRGPLGNLVTFV